MTELQQIARNTAPKRRFSLVVSGRGGRISTRFQQPIRLDPAKGYEMALVNLETYYSFPNIHERNRVFSYSPDDGANWYSIALKVGSYDIEDINAEIQRRMRQNGHGAKIIIGANRATLRAVLILREHYQVNFDVPNSIRTVLGFNEETYIYDPATQGYFESESIVNIINVSRFLVNSDIISGSYVDGVQQPVIYSFFPNVSPGMKIVQNPKNLIYLPVTVNTIHSMVTHITDQDGLPIDLRGEHLTMRFHLREI